MLEHVWQHLRSTAGRGRANPLFWRPFLIKINQSNSNRKRTAAAREKLSVIPGGQSMQELDYAKVGARIRQIRKAKGWSQDELAKKCGISMNFMGHIERGTRKMSLDTFARICAGLEANADALLWGVVQESQAMIQDLWKQPKKADSDSYSMYIQIMKSVADIMRSKDENAKQRVKE